MSSASTSATPTRQVEYRRPKLARYQVEALFCPERYSVVEATTKAGKTVGCMAWLVEQAVINGKPGRQFWWTAPILDQARIAFKRIKRGLPAAIFTPGEMPPTVTLGNGAILAFKGGDHPDSLYGEDVYAAVIDEGSRCFVAGTQVDTPTGPRAIEELCVGDQVLNAAGASHVLRTLRRQASRLVRVTVQGCGIISTPEHRYLTQRGWVEAQHLEPDDALIRQDAAVRLVRDAVPSACSFPSSGVLLSRLLAQRASSTNRNAPVRGLRHFLRCGAGKATNAPFLRAVLLSEMANGTTGDTSEGVRPRDASQGNSRLATMVGARHSASSRSASVGGRSQCNARSSCAREDFRLTTGWRAPAAVAGRQGARPDGCAAHALDSFGRGVDLRGFGASTTAAVRHADLLLHRHCSADAEISGRGGWQHPSVDGGTRRRYAQNSVPTSARVDRVEVLESGHPEFTTLSGDSDTVPVYDLTVSRHPSFSVNGFLVHNCKEEVFHAIRSTLTATGGPLRIIGNVKGRKNWAYVLARKAEAGEPNWHYAKITAYDAVKAGILNAEEVEDARRTLPEHVFGELYLAEPSDDGGNPFGIAAIAACIEPLHADCKPQQWGWDLAKSVDWTWGLALCEHGAVCRSERFQSPWQDTITRIKTLTGYTSALVDSTGVGDPVLESLQAGGGGNFEGFKFSSTSKQQLMEGLAVAIQTRRVRFPDGPLRVELDAFEYQYTRTGVRYCAADGMHDDGVAALALVHRCRELNPGGPLLLWGGSEYDDDG